jgi:hypothetical protein
MNSLRSTHKTLETTKTSGEQTGVAESPEGEFLKQKNENVEFQITFS